jgi:hypothetical protein
MASAAHRCASEHRLHITALDKCSANFLHPRHTLICQRHMTAHHTILPTEKGYETRHGHKYVSTYKSLLYKYTGI